MTPAAPSPQPPGEGPAGIQTPITTAAATGNTSVLVDARPAASNKRTQALRGRSFLNHQQRLGIIKKRDEEPTWSQVELARWAAAHFHLPKEPSQGTIAILLKKREQLTAATVSPQTRTIRPPRHPELEAALLLWVRFLQNKRVPFTGENIRLKASFLAKQLNLDTNLNFSTGWMSGFVSRHDLVLARAHKKKQGETEDEPVRSVLKKYEPRDVFFLGETALIYNDLPFDTAHADQANPNRDRLCVGLAVNMDGSEKLEPLVITTYKRKVSVLSTVFYNAEGKMTTRIFEQWLYSLNQIMASAHRSVVLLVDSSPSHFPVKMSNIRLVVLPPKVNNQLSHPMELGITKAFKALYRKAHLSHAVDDTESTKHRLFDVSVTRALHWIIHAWHDVPHEVIHSCLVRTGLTAIRDQPGTLDVTGIHPELAQSLAQRLAQLQLLNAMPVETLLFSESEEDVHYVYDDESVVRMVAGEGIVEEQADDDEDMEDEVEKTKRRLSQVATASTTIASSGATSQPRWKKAMRKDQDSTGRLEKEQTLDELLAKYRAVIQSLDESPDRSDDHDVALRFLRRKQEELALRVQNPRQLQAQNLQCDASKDQRMESHAPQPVVLEAPPPSATATTTASESSATGGDASTSIVL